VVIPVFDGERSVQATLDTLLCQTYPRELYEIIIVDNNSTDETPDLVGRYAVQYPHLIRLVYEREIQGAYAARNTGIRIAEGEILAFTDSDCLPCRDWIEKGCQSLQDSRVSFAAGRIDMIFKEQRPNIWEYLDAARKLNQRAYVEKAGFGATANLFVRRGLFDKYGLFRSDLQSGGDYEFGRRLTIGGEKLVYADRVIVRHPARDNFKAILNKSRRVAKGQKQLADMGLLKHGTLSRQSLRLVRRCPEMEGVFLNAKQRLVVVFMVNVVKYLNVLRRL